MNNSIKEAKIHELLTDLKEAFKDLKEGQNVKFSLHTEYEPCEYHNPLNTFSLWVSKPYYSSPDILDYIKPIIELLFDWDYKMRAKFDVTITIDSFDIIFHEPVISYKNTSKMFSLKEREV